MQTQTQFFRFLAAALVFLPLLFLVLRTASGTPRRLKCALAAVFASSLLFFCTFHHQDLYRGLDNAMYANIAKAFRSGVQAVRVDTFFSSIPEKAAHAFVLQKSKTWHKKSHDKAFVLSPDGLSRPWFMLMHPLVASALPEDLFVPLLGAIWLTLLFLVCCRGTGVAAGVGVFCVLVFATPYPMWFFRDDFAEVSGSMLVATALLSHSAKPLKHPAEFAVAAFLVGLATAFHRSTLLFAVPVALLFFAEAGSWKSRLAVAAAFGIGLLALWLETRYVSAPYGDWTRIVPKEPHKGSTAVKVIHKSTKYVVPKSPDYFASFAQGLKPAAKSLGFPALTLFLAGTFSLFRGKRPGIVRKALPFVLLWVLCACICRLGKDAHTGHIVGVWDFRRIFPCVIVLVSLFAAPLAELVAALLAKIRLAARWKKASVVAVAALLCTLCIARNPTAYFAVDGKGNREFADEIGAELEQLKPDLVVFDYFLHHLPFVFDGRFTALGIDERKHGSWGAAAGCITRRRWRISAAR
ncbi:MAG: hypothetical protein J6Y19_10765, partial [Kiritimatiellae bacterium]|nr:hypothetical protein [Kiritimatiellia bacterium]